MQTVEASPRSDPRFLVQAVTQLAMTQALREFEGKVDVVLLGDSITQGWQWNAAQPQVFAGLKALNLGLGGDQTVNLLWRLEQGLIDDLNVRAAVILIGINDCWDAPSAEEVVRRIELCLVRARKALPQAAILLYGLFPLRDKTPIVMDLIPKINGKLHDLAARHKVDYRDIIHTLSDDQGQIHCNYTTDGCHLSDTGYQIWGRDLRQWMLDIIKGTSKNGIFS